MKPSSIKLEEILQYILIGMVCLIAIHPAFAASGGSINTVPSEGSALLLPLPASVTDIMNETPSFILVPQPWTS